ncbi:MULTISPECIES: family 78 glycoside hydrolase catalytic domain [unclassified Nocardiopsis]|uniref:family 78 glycoside hydrolase catalytic domain n=1 Tax=unclassified Nocardiopsis TaxID=2649073 RepID=UPI00135876E8|nr:MULTISPECIES: family 78 glycoside hydrolase catalytic domain [unclassified Nocardiopsis]
MPATADPAVSPVRVEHHRVPLGIGEAGPRLSWTPSHTQTAYELHVSGGDTTLTTGRVDSADSVLVPWPAPELPSRARRAVRVRVWDEHGRASAWSEPTVLETGLIGDPRTEWAARMISPAPELTHPADPSDGAPAAYLRGVLTLDPARRVSAARLRATARGLMTLSLNGEPVGDEALHPGWTTYRHRLRYRTWDVTDAVRGGANTLLVHLADGWYRGFVGFGGRREVYGADTAALVQLEVDYEDGSRLVAGTDGSWHSAASPVTRADIQKGQTLDVRRVLSPDEIDWLPVTERGFDPATLVAPTGPPVRATRTLAAQRILTSPSGATLVDFGQNLVGRLRVRVPRAAAGTRLSFRHAEVLEHGELGTRPLRAATQWDELVLAGPDADPRTWEPEFTFHGFRYVRVDGWPGELGPEDLEAVVLHTDMRRLGEFACSDPLLDRLHENVVWGMRGNFVDLPTDCPQRDERLGWTGDLQVFAPTAAFLYDTAGMLRGWLADLAHDQSDSGGVVPPFVPFAELDDKLPPLGAEAGWGDAATVVPWTVYERSGDAGILHTQWDSMTAWVDAFAARAGERLDFASGGFSFGDWLDSAAPDDQPWAARVPWQLVATGYLARSARILARAGEVLSDRDPRFAKRAEDYRALAERAAARFRDEYVTATGRAAFPAQTAYAMALVFDLLLPEQRQHAGDLLAEQVAKDDYRIGTGFLGTPLVCDALADTGHAATAWRLLLQRECPSWLYAVTMGATTVWERWNSMLPDGSVNPGEMTSFNHYALGAIADYLHRRVAGLAPAAPGYRRLRVAPLPTRELEWARASHQTPYGRAEAGWTREGDEVTVTVTVPAGTRAEVHLPGGEEPLDVGPGEHAFRSRLPEEVVAARPPAFA